MSQLVPAQTLSITQTNQEDIVFAPARQLDPLRIVQGTCNQRYDCPDVSTLDQHITRLRHRIATVGSSSPTYVAACRADIDRLLDRRAWLTL